MKTFRSGFVALVGKPNVGKSTLLNAYLGQKIAIVSAKPQTTRVRQLGVLTRPDAQIVFIDTPGIHAPMHRLGEAMVQAALEALGEADVIVFLADAATPPGEQDQHIAAVIQRSASGAVILALNKCDLVPAEWVEARVQAYQALLPGADWILVSATGGQQRDQLLDMIVAHLPVGEPYYDADTLTDRTEREIAAELVREQVLQHTAQEVPHAVAVVVDEWKERTAGKLYISATLYVEKESQKGILIGHQGQMLKAISTAARQEIEELTGQAVFLQLWVKVNPNWRKNEVALERLGYSIPRRRGRKR